MRPWHVLFEGVAIFYPELLMLCDQKAGIIGPLALEPIVLGVWLICIHGNYVISWYITSMRHCYVLFEGGWRKYIPPV